MKKIFILFSLFVSLSGFSQNLIPNYSFEDTVETPIFMPTEWKAANREGWNYYTPFNNQLLPDWGAPQNIGGYQKAKTGTSYVGINLYNLWSINSNRSNSREYLQVKLKQPLKYDSTYCFQLYMSLADSIHFASKNMLGIYFSAQAVSAFNLDPLPYTPQLVVSPNAYITDRINWVKIDLQYKAVGGEQYVTLGNFNDTTYIDTVFVPGGGTQFWMEASYYYLDDIWLSSCDSLPDTTTRIGENQIKEKFRFYPNPSKDQITIEFAVKTDVKVTFELIDLLGRKQYEQKLSSGNVHQLNVEQLPAAVYVYQLKVNNKVIKANKLIIR